MSRSTARSMAMATTKMHTAISMLRRVAGNQIHPSTPKATPAHLLLEEEDGNNKEKLSAH
jgi:hypothetical protein